MLDNNFKKNYIMSSSDGYLELMILPTEKCNFRCVYCYEKFEHGAMSEDVVNGIKNLLTKSAPTLKRLVIGWFGGEPTLNYKGIVEISEHIVKLQKKYKFYYRASMTTNGYLLNRKTAETYIALGINSYQISLDGSPEQHNTTRILANGKGTFKQIWNNLIAMKEIEQDFNIVLRLHVTNQNSTSMLKLCESIADELLIDQRFRTNIERIINMGPGVSDQAKNLVAKNINETIKQMKKILSTSGTDQDKLNYVPSNYICYAAKPRQLMIRANGTLGKCTVMLEDDRNNLGRIYKDGSIEVDGSKLEVWTQGFASLDTKAISCPARSLPKLKKKELIDIVQVA